MNTTASITVHEIPSIDSFLKPLIKAWWPYVTKAPEESNKKVFNKGTPNGFKGVIPCGGQLPPISTLGIREEWKKAQKIEKKARASLIMNKIIPRIIPFCTFWVWAPKKLPSITTSLNHKAIDEIVKQNPKFNKVLPKVKPWKYTTEPIVKFNKEKLTKIGQGDKSTRWYGKGWNSDLLIEKEVAIFLKRKFYIRI